MNVTACLALQIIPEHLRNEPVFLCIDDTMIAKFGKKFENVSKLFDHASIFDEFCAVFEEERNNRFEDETEE